ncbi:diaminobutyrate acetyltransferase [Tropicimonas sp. IMCC34011]|uniref:diaminobutyrate acetyltransferase n=1 Tax=Tropicimonas sp. IMCC34011 TaxID=2248759 RepID=UPI000E262C08|nr:diaminobutyrate acetyltransferase [Tropicimonas sp. IMCC34011]
MPKDMSRETEKDADTRKPVFRKPEAEDGSDIWNLVRACKPLDENSMYCNLIQADHFSDTCVVAELDGEIVGWISGHIIPGENAFFVWQVAVGEQARGLGLGKRMLKHLISRDVCEEVDLLKTTITKSNDASWGLFRSFARSIGGELTHEPHFEKEAHFDGQAATEHMLSITIPRKRSELRAVA